MLLARAAARRRMIAIRQKRAAARKAHQDKVVRAKKVIARAKKEGWFKAGQSISFWTSRSAWNLRRQWLARKRQNQARGRAQRQSLARRREANKRLVSIGKCNFKKARKIGWFDRRRTMGYGYWWSQKAKMQWLKREYIKKQSRIANRRKAIARRQGWIRFVKVPNCAWTSTHLANQKPFNRLRAIGMQ